ncbi:hypothetical protein [Castellaniella sp. GW247-6E4]
MRWFKDAALALRRRIEWLLPLPRHRLDVMSLQHERCDIGKKWGRACPYT